MEQAYATLSSVAPSLTFLEKGVEVYAAVMFNLIIAEVVFDLMTNRHRDYRQSAVNYAINVLQELLSYLPFIFFSDRLIAFFYQFSLIKLPVNLQTTLAAVLVADLIFYGFHRLSHRSRLFWSSHAVHHSSTDFDLTVTFRLGWIETIFIYSLFFTPMSVVGFHPAQTFFASGFVLTYQTWIHTQKIGKLGILESILNTPSNHRVHHVSNPQYIDKNYGAVLIIWDKLFGTYEPEVEKVIYGVTDNIESCNPITINFIEYARILYYLHLSKGRGEMAKSIFGPPEWKPKAFLEQVTQHASERIPEAIPDMAQWH
jgi:sterol desaturase/sphingolipid hydroxylase (fatty acid hydroxylase superfamily)